MKKLIRFYNLFTLELARRVAHREGLELCEIRKVKDTHFIVDQNGAWWKIGDRHFGGKET